MLKLRKLNKMYSFKRFHVDRLRDLETANKFKVDISRKFYPVLRLEETLVEAMWQETSEGFKSVGEEVKGI